MRGHGTLVQICSYAFPRSAGFDPSHIKTLASELRWEDQWIPEEKPFGCLGSPKTGPTWAVPHAVFCEGPPVTAPASDL